MIFRDKSDRLFDGNALFHAMKLHDYCTWRGCGSRCCTHFDHLKNNSAQKYLVITSDSILNVLFAHVCGCVHAWMCACVRACMRVCVCVCVRESKASN